MTSVEYLIARLEGSKTMTELRDMWNSISFAYQKDPRVMQAKAKRKAELS